MAEFHVDRISTVEIDGTEWTIYTLDQAKNGFNKIAFSFSNQERLNSVLMQCFLGPRSFDFEIDPRKTKDAKERLGAGHCMVSSISLR